MGILDAGIDLLKGIKEFISDEPFDSGLRFEKFVLNNFSPKYFSIVERTHSTETNQERYVESSMNPDFVFRYNPSGEMFAVECKYRTDLYDGMLKWSYPAQLKRYRGFSYNRRMQVYIVIGLGGIDDDPEEMCATRNYIINCRNAPPSIRSDLSLACIFSNETV